MDLAGKGQQLGLGHPVKIRWRRWHWGIGWLQQLHLERQAGQRPNRRHHGQVTGDLEQAEIKRKGHFCGIDEW